MRKRILKSIYLIILVALVALLIGSFFINRPSEIHVSAYTKPYSVNSSVDISDSIDIEILIDEAESFYSDKKQIVNAYITGEEGKIKLKIKEVYIETDPIIVYEDKFYVFHYLFDIDFQTNENFELFLDEAYLEIKFLNGISSKIKVGSFSYYKYENNSNDLMLSLLKVINNYNGITNFYGFQVGIRNLSTYGIKINNIKLLDVNAEIGNPLKLSEINESKNIMDYFDNYNDLQEVDQLDIEINSSENVYLAVPLVNMTKYKLMYPLEKAGILIDYSINGNNKTFIFENFVFYKQNYIDLSSNTFEIYTYDNN